MLRKWGTLVLFLLVTPALAWAQNTGKLSGVVVDASTGEPLPGANVVLAGTSLGTAADIDGSYFIIGIPVGTYDVQASFVGYQAATISDVDILSGYTTELNFELQPGAELDEIVVEYERPLIQKDAIGTPKVVSGEDIENLPVRGVASVAALQGGVISNDAAGGDLYVRGGRDEQVVYYVDGVKVVGSLAVPTQAIQEQEMLIGTIPARYGDAMSGVISITTKSGAPEFFGSVEAITSEGLDPWGYSLGSLSIGGPIVPGRLSFFVSAQGTYEADSSPYATESPLLPDDRFESLLQNPQVLQIQNAETGELDYISLPGDLPEGATVAELEAQLAESGALAEGFEVVSFNPYVATQVLTAEDFDFQDDKDNPDTDLDLTGSLTFDLTDAISLRAGGAYAKSDLEGYTFSRSLYNRDRFYESETQTYRFFGTWRHRLSGSTFYQLQADYSSSEGYTYPNGFGTEVSDAMFFGDIDHPVNAVAARYKTYCPSGTSDPTCIASGIPTETDDDGTVSTTEAGYAQRGLDGTLRVSNVTNVWAGAGAGAGTFQHSNTKQFRLFASATTQIGVHQIEFGGEYEQRTQRYYSLGGTGLARYICDATNENGEIYNDANGNGSIDPGELVAENCGAESVDPDDLFDDEGNFLGATSYDEIPFAAFEDNALWYGYDFRGIDEVDDQSITDYVAGTNYNVAPYEPIYYAGYIQDKIEFRDLVINLGLRVDVFDNNTEVLADPFAVAPIVRAGDVPADLKPQPAVNDDWAVYFNDQGTIVGFRDRDGTFYDELGQESNFSTINTLGGQRQKEGTDQLSEEIFTDYEPQVTWMPRIGVSFPVTDQALFFASYNVTSQRPRENVFEPFNTYKGISGQNRLNNPALEPEKTVQYELGFRQALGARAALQISAFLRQQDNLIQVRNVNGVGLGIGSYGNYQNVDFATTKGVELEFDLRRTNNVSMRANYTFSVAKATGSDSNTLATIAWRGTLGGGLYFPNFISEASFDRRHSINITADYRLGEDEGPMAFGGYPLENFGFNVIANLGSGMPYTALLGPSEIWSGFTENVDGSVNGQRLPWTYRLDLRVDRTFDLGNRASLSAFVWVQNLLNTENILGVYRATGLADDDGFLATTLGLRTAEAAAAALGDPVATESFLFHYENYVGAPIGLGGSQYSGGPRYSLPRRTRIGLRLNF